MELKKKKDLLPMENILRRMFNHHDTNQLLSMNDLNCICCIPFKYGTIFFCLFQNTYETDKKETFQVLKNFSQSILIAAK